MHGREALRKLHWKGNKNERQVQEGPKMLGGESKLAKIRTGPPRHNIIKCQQTKLMCLKRHEVRYIT